MMFLYLISCLVFARVISAVCYNINGNAVTSTDTVPCNNTSGSISMCCATNRSLSSPYTPDTCLPNGLCQNIFTNLTTNKPDTNYWREGCSDNLWNSQYCLAGICSSSSEVDGNGNGEMTPCDGTATSAKWCCGTHNTACCGTGKEIILAAILGAATTSSSSSASKTSSTTASSTISQTQSSQTFSPTANPTATSNPAPPSGLSTGAKAGIGIGCVGLAVLVAGAIFYFFRRKKTSQAANPSTELATGNHQDERKFELHSMSQQRLSELQGNGFMAGSRGMSGDGRMTELP